MKLIMLAAAFLVGTPALAQMPQADKKIRTELEPRIERKIPDIRLQNRWEERTTRFELQVAPGVTLKEYESFKPLSRLPRGTPGSGDGVEIEFKKRF